MAPSEYRVRLICEESPIHGAIVGSGIGGKEVDSPGVLIGPGPWTDAWIVHLVGLGSMKSTKASKGPPRGSNAGVS